MWEKTARLTTTDRPNSAQPSNASSNSADRLQPANSQQTYATWRDLPGSRQAGSHQLQRIAPYNGRRADPASGSGRSKTETASSQLGSRSTASNGARSAEYSLCRADWLVFRRCQQTGNQAAHRNGRAIGSLKILTRRV